MSNYSKNLKIRLIKKQIIFVDLIKFNSLYTRIVSKCQIILLRFLKLRNLVV